MKIIGDYVLPLLLLFLCCIGLRKKENIYGIMMEGASDGLRLLLTIVPTLILLMSAIAMLRASGAIDLLNQFLTPVFQFIGIPPETGLLVLIRPLSGSAALAVGAELMAQHGVDSLIGRTTAIMLGSTETTFYTISVYFGASKIKKTRYAIPAALLADITGFLIAAISAKLFFS